MTRQAAVGFVDLCGFTGFTDRQGDAAALQLALSLYADLDRNLEGSTRVVKRIGDGALLVADRTCDLTATLARTVSGWNGANAIPLRATTAQGPLLQHEGDVFGALVNRAAHLLRGARPGTIVSL
jgi:adenylate cyclase